MDAFGIDDRPEGQVTLKSFFLTDQILFKFGESRRFHDISRKPVQSIYSNNHISTGYPFPEPGRPHRAGTRQRAGIRLGRHERQIR